MIKMYRKGLAAARRAAALLFAAAILGTTVVTAPVQARAASWMDPYLERAVSWGIMKGDPSGNLNENKVITRAEFVTIINRAFGYTEMGPTPFTDVPPGAWYEENIAIAYRAGYFTGSSPTTASPDMIVTREQAVTVLGRNMRMQSKAGAITDYSDDAQMANWSRGYIQEASDMGIVEGSGGAFYPSMPITRGQAACMIVRAMGSLINQPGEQSAGAVYGNLTINSPGVTLKNTVVTGNLYLCGGIGLESVVLDNVTVLGKIVVCGAGTSQKGEPSVILRNVTASGMEIDNMTDQFVSVRADGLTNIQETTVRTQAYLEDLTDNGLGLQLIKQEGASQLQLVGNIKEVINLTPDSGLFFGRGVADKVTVDEKATGSTVTIDTGSNVRDLNLDTGVAVDGGGDIGDLIINSGGSEVTIPPNTVTIRPGGSADVAGGEMDSTGAEEYSEDPRLLAGYPTARNVGPKAADAVFSANKAGTIYWAVTTLMDGSVDEDVLTNPSSYSAKIIKSGTLKPTSSKQEMTAKLSGLTVDGSYYISALIEDSRGRRSPVKVAAFTTPDDTVPAFASGYPTAAVINKDGEQIVQATVMATKSCQLYYALLPKGSSAPSAADFKAAAVSGNLGYGVIDVRKNTQHLLPKVNSSYLKEQTAYDLYLWLNDADNGKSSAVKKLAVTTPDNTPPVIRRLDDVTDTGDKSSAGDKSISLTFSLDEPGTLHWAVVKQGMQFYGKGITDPNSLAAKVQIENGVGSLKKGSTTVSKADAEGKINITGLEPQTAYDLYYVAKDKAGNYNVYTAELTPPMVVRTRDRVPPTVEQEFTKDGTDDPKHLAPYPDTSIRLVFSESVQGIMDVNGEPVYHNFKELYDAIAKAGADDRENAEKELADALHAHIKLYYKPASGQPEEVAQRTDTSKPGDDWTIDYRKAKVEMDPSGTGEMIITFPYNTADNLSGLNLLSGVTYYFELEGIADTAARPNRMAGTRGITKLQEFTTIDAQMIFSQGSSTGTDENDTTLEFDMNFRLSPATVGSVSNDVVWDLLFWSKFNMKFELYYHDDIDGNDTWTKVKNEGEFICTTQDPKVGISLSRQMKDPVNGQIGFEQLNKVSADREYGIIVTELDGSKVRGEWGDKVELEIQPVAGDRGAMTVLANTGLLTPKAFQDHQAGIYAVKEIGVPRKYTVACPFTDEVAPTFKDGCPEFTPGDSSVEIDIMLSKKNNASYYYVVTEVGNITTMVKQEGKDDELLTKDNWDKLLPENGVDFDGVATGNVTLPTRDSITNPPYTGDKYKTGSGKYNGAKQTIDVTGLKAETQYVAYFVLQGGSTKSFSEVFVFRFKTEKVVRPVLTVSLNNPSATVTSTGEKPKEADVKYLVIVDGKEGELLNKKMSEYWDDAAAKQYGLTKEEIEKYKELTLLKAMATGYNNGSVALGSVFDLFSTVPIQNEMSAWILSANSNGTSIMGSGDMNLTQSNRLTSTVDCKKFMDPKNPNMNYWFVAMGKSKLGSAYAFSASSYLYYPELTPPQLITVSTENSSNLTDDYSKAVNQVYSGTVTITFSTDLYYKDGSKYKQVVDMSIEDLGTDTDDKYVSSAVLITSSKVSVDHQVEKDNTSYPRCRTLILEFTAVRSGNQISFTQNLSDSRGTTGINPLTLTMKLEKDSQGFWAPKFNVTSEGWGNPVVQ